MDNKLFDDLLSSLKEAGAIHRGELEPSRTFAYEIPDVKSIREKTGLTQVEFANKLHISPRTLQNWEQGHRNPTGPAMTLIKLIDKKPDLLDLA
ncbi:NadS family protein [Psychrobacter sp. I-STPA10]|uniref:NadS family protein n=1 Tax=Psychrobacter sp. I-STPA10 TaxID=2585769 RepID=UPI001E620696|nr:NadS family protein [Psychrobacter sp. I-STPA10]